MASLFLIMRRTVKKDCSGHAFVFSESLYQRGEGNTGGRWVFSEGYNGYTALMEITTWKAVWSKYSGTRVKRRFLIDSCRYIDTCIYIQRYILFIFHHGDHMVLMPVREIASILRIFCFLFCASVTRSTTSLGSVSLLPFFSFLFFLAPLLPPAGLNCLWVKCQKFWLPLLERKGGLFERLSFFQIRLDKRRDVSAGRQRLFQRVFPGLRPLLRPDARPRSLLLLL